MRTYIYIDGFNFYYNALKGTPHKWIDFKSLFTKLLDPKHEILQIKYFTAIVTGKIDPYQPVRQKTFIRAIEKFIPELSVYYGNFTSHNVFQPLSNPIDKSTFGKEIRFAQIIKTEEKGSDVNLAVHLLNDSWKNLFDCAIIVSNDSDLAESIRLVKEQNKKTIGIIFPSELHKSKDLLPLADFIKVVRKSVLATSQLPNPIPETTLHKPTSWG